MGQETNQEDLTQRVRRTLEDLTAIRQSLATDAEQGRRSDPGHDSYLDLELAAELKSVLDTLRTMLWAYIQALSAKSGRRPEEVLERYKMEMTVEMLRSARPRPSPPLQTQPSTFFTFEELVNNALAVTAAYRRQ